MNNQPDYTINLEIKRGDELLLKFLVDARRKPGGKKEQYGGYIQSLCTDGQQIRNLVKEALDTLDQGLDHINTDTTTLGFAVETD